MRSIKRLLSDDAKIVKEAKLSKSALIITWVSIPGGILLFLLLTYFPVYIDMLIKGKVKEFIINQENMNTEKQSLFKYITSEIFGNIHPVIWFIVCFFVFLLFSAWLFWSLYLTKKFKQNELLFTTEEVVGRNKKNVLKIPLKAVSNIYVEKSLWGRIFKYGTITIVSSKGSVSIENIAFADEFADELSGVTIKKENHFFNI